MDADDLLADPAALGRFRYTVAAVVKFLIRARRAKEPAFLSPAELESWNLNPKAAEKYTTTQLLELAKRNADELREPFICFCPSGGYGRRETWEGEGDVGVVKGLFVEFVNPIYWLPQAIDDSRMGRALDWDQVAQWEVLPELRAALDRLPHPPGHEPEDGRSGPDHAGNVWWNGNHQKLEATPHRLCQYLWGKERVSEEAAINAVWGSDDRSSGGRALPSALSKMNKTLLMLSVPWEYVRDRAHIVKKSK